MSAAVAEAVAAARAVAAHAAAANTYTFKAVAADDELGLNTDADTDADTDTDTDTGFARPADPIAAARRVNLLLRHLCELTYLCLQTLEADEPEQLADLLAQRQTAMSEIDWLHGAPDQTCENAIAAGFAGPAAADGTCLPPHLDDPGLAAERRDLLHLLRSLDTEVLRLSEQRLDEYRTDLRKSLTGAPGPYAERAATGRLFSHIG